MTDVPTERLEEILRGCEGVTPGPWRFPGTRMGGDASVIAAERLIASVHPRRLRAPFTEDNAERDANAAHIARLDPQTVASIIRELLSHRSAPAGGVTEAIPMRLEREAEHIARDMREGRFPSRSEPIMVPDVDDAWDRVGKDTELARARAKLSMHEIRLIIRHGVEADREHRAALTSNVRNIPEQSGGDVEAAAKAGWNACRKSIYAVCEDIQERASDPNKVSLAKLQSEKDHERGYYLGEAQAAKSIARGFNAMEAADDDNFTAVLPALRRPAEAAVLAGWVKQAMNYMSQHGTLKITWGDLASMLPTVTENVTVASPVPATETGQSRNEVLEEAAKVCDEKAKVRRSMANDTEPDDEEHYALNAQGFILECAAADIRSLRTTEPKHGGEGK